MEKIAIIAGNGNLPYFFYETALKSGYEVYPLGLFDTVNNKLAKSEKYKKINIGELGNLLDFLKENQIKKLIMLGKVEKSIIYKDLIIDDKLRTLINTLPDRKDETLVLGIISVLKENGIEIMPQHFLMDSLVTQEKTYTKTSIDEDNLKDIQIGIEASKMLGKLDVGQTVVVKKKSVVALEAVEGTDETIKRAGIYAGSDCIIVKTSRPQQDMRVDVPAIGLKTIEEAIKIGAKGIIIESGRVLFLEEKEAVDIANKNNMFIAGIKI